MNGYRVFFFSSRRRHTRFDCDWSSDVCSSDLFGAQTVGEQRKIHRAGRAIDAAVFYGGHLIFKNGFGVVQESSNERSEERRVGEEGRSRGAPYHLKKKKKK